MTVKRKLKQYLPEPETFFKNRWLRWCAPWMGHPRLWNMHRRSVALGVAIGLITGLIPGPLQILTAVLIAIVVRANIPAAAFATLYTNPFTFIPLYMLAYKVGGWVTGEATSFKPPAEFQFTWERAFTFIPDLFRWMISLGDTLLIGLAIQSTITAIVGYVLTMLIWRCAVSRAWGRRAKPV
jgi:uncharacterized protein